MAASFLLQNDSHSRFLLNDGVSFILLNQSAGGSSSSSSGGGPGTGKTAHGQRKRLRSQSSLVTTAPGMSRAPAPPGMNIAHRPPEPAVASARDFAALARPVPPAVTRLMRPVERILDSPVNSLLDQLAA